ncbi:MAG: glycosyl hydrolase family 43 [Spirochaetota bacterium]
MTIADFLALTWEDGGQALIEPSYPSPVLADPSFLFPSETPSGLWTLYAHSAFGINRFESADGLSWKKRGMVSMNSMRAFVRKIDDEYLLFYEHYLPFALPLQLLPKRPRWRSHLELRRSRDLRRWSAPVSLIEADFDWSRDDSLGDSISNPCLIKMSDGWRLWFSSSLVTVPDCGFDEPLYIGCALGPSPGGPFLVEGKPRIDPSRDSLPGVLGAGSMKVVAMDDGWIGLQNKIYAGPDGKSRSAIFVLRSEEGLEFRLAREEPLIAPTRGWRASHVYACDCRIDPRDGLVYLYFNARDGWYKAEGKERIGRIVGRLL